MGHPGPRIAAGGCRDRESEGKLPFAITECKMAKGGAKGRQLEEVKFLKQEKLAPFSAYKVPGLYKTEKIKRIFPPGFPMAHHQCFSREKTASSRAYFHAGKAKRKALEQRPKCLVEKEWSDRRDSNSRPFVPQTNALTRLRYDPIFVSSYKIFRQIEKSNCGGRKTV